jgi:hypothetical protein
MMMIVELKRKMIDLRSSALIFIIINSTAVLFDSCAREREDIHFLFQSVAFCDR